jgi:4'-phosphopantetheinyl transferase
MSLRRETSERVPAALTEGEAHVWQVPLAAARQAAAAAADCLSAAEKDRAGRRCGERADGFVTTRVALRHVLGRYCAADPAIIEIVEGTYGKPLLPAGSLLEFSVSHTGDIGLIAVARAAVGVDVERVRRPQRLERVAGRIFHPDTAAALQRLPEPARTLAFTDAWTQREAHVKAVGGGLFRTADTLPFDAAQSADGRVCTTRDRATGAIWSSVRFRPDQQSRATLVVRGALHTLRTREPAAVLDLLRAR